MPFHKSKKAEMQELLTFVQNSIKTAPPAEVVDLNLEEKMADAYYKDDSEGLHYSE